MLIKWEEKNKLDISSTTKLNKMKAVERLNQSKSQKNLLLD